MFRISNYSFFLVLICCCQFSLAQENPAVKDTAKMYRNIENYSKKSKFTKYIHRLIFEPVAKQKVKKNTYQKKMKKDLSAYECKIIRKIRIVTLDPFGYSPVDSTMVPNRFVYKASNSLHAKSKKFAIRNLLLIKRNTPFDSLLVKESERLIRSQRFVRSVAITSEVVSQDSVDVTIRVLDAWSLLPDVRGSVTKTTFYLKDRNFFGTGHEFANSYSESLTTSQFGYSTSYTVPNIMNTFIRTNVRYEIGFDNDYSKSFSAERPFFSPYARWAAGAFVGQNFEKPIYIDANQNAIVESIKYNSQDFWAGRSFQIFKGNSEFNRATNFIMTARYFDREYTQKPISVVDSLGIYSREHLYLFGFGISSRKYVQDTKIFNFNVTEDVATGFVYNVTTGYQKKNSLFRFYAGGRVSIGDYFKFGYLSGNVEYGTFLNEGKTVQSTITFKSIYFTNLIETGKWSFRQFIKPQLTLGNNRLASNSDRLSLNEPNGIQGFSSETFLGTKKLLVTFQTQGYSPWELLGFRLNPFFSYSMGMLGQRDTGFKGSKVYSQLGLGIIVSNDYLVFNSFQFSFSFYPTIPGAGDSILKTNSFQTSDFGLQNFEIAKPVLVDYQ